MAKGDRKQAETPSRGGSLEMEIHEAASAFDTDPVQEATSPSRTTGSSATCTPRPWWGWTVP